MAVIRPFKGVRPAQDLVQEIAALPYDVYSSEEARDFVSDKPNSFLKIDRAETFFDPSVDSHSQAIYEKARDVLYKMIEDGKFIQDPSPVLYIYELTMGGRHQRGLVACASVDDYLSGVIKKHENTRADKELDRINHVDYTDANTGPIFLTYKAKPSISALTKSWVASHEAVYDFIAEDNVEHKVWVVDDLKVIEGIVEGFGGVKGLYIADGHHRAASAVKVAQMRRESHPGYTGEEEFNYFLSVIFQDEQLAIMDYNRVVKDLNGLSETSFLAALKSKFDVTEESASVLKPTEKASFGMYMNNKWYRLKAKDGSYDAEDPVKSLDVAIIQDNLLRPILGIEDPKTDQRIDFIGGIRGMAELERRVKHDMKVAFALYPTSIEELIAIADVGKLMPPKSTWFEPKLRSGVFIHLLK